MYNSPLPKLPVKKIKIKILPKAYGKTGATCFIDGKQVFPDDVLEIPEDIARDLIFRGLAQLEIETKEISTISREQVQTVSKKSKLKNFFSSKDETPVFIAQNLMQTK